MKYHKRLPKATIENNEHMVNQQLQFIRELEAENKKLREALEKIAFADYRGNRTKEMFIAQKALKDL